MVKKIGEILSISLIVIYNRSQINTLVLLPARSNVQLSAANTVCVQKFPVGILLSFA
jgi:hypothetical protein